MKPPSFPARFPGIGNWELALSVKSNHDSLYWCGVKSETRDICESHGITRSSEPCFSHRACQSQADCARIVRQERHQASFITARTSKPGIADGHTRLLTQSMNSSMTLDWWLYHFSGHHLGFEARWCWNFPDSAGYTICLSFFFSWNTIRSYIEQKRLVPSGELLWGQKNVSDWNWADSYSMFESIAANIVWRGHC